MGAPDNIRMRGINPFPIFLPEENRQNFMSRVGSESIGSRSSA